MTGQETLLIGGTGTAGCNGRGARIYRRDGNNVWTPIVDYLVDDNQAGSNENGFGWNIGSTDFFRSAFQAWSWVDYGGSLLVGVAKLEAGGMIYSTDSASELDGAWNFSMGGTDRVKNPVTGIAMLHRTRRSTASGMCLTRVFSCMLSMEPCMQEPWSPIRVPNLN